MPALIAFIALAVLGGKAQDNGSEAMSTTDASPERETVEAIEAESAIHARRHNAIDLRVTVFLLAFLTILTGIIKDGARLVSLPLTLSIAIVSACGIVACGVSLYASRRNVKRARTPEQIIMDARMSNPLMVAAAQLSSMEAISSRKTHSSNIALFILVIDSILLCAGLVL